MSTSAQTDSERTSRQQGSSECKPLIDAATKDLFRKNAFRITGLSVDATAREVAKHADKLKMLVELGQDPHTKSAAFPISPPPTMDEIREAIQKLQDPEKRLIDEFFWFWPETFGRAQSDAAIQALARGDSKAALKLWSEAAANQSHGISGRHNLAIFWHLAALEWEQRSLNREGDDSERLEIDSYWREAFRNWEQLSVDDNLWQEMNTRIRQIGDARLRTGFARRMRISLPEALHKINAELALAHAGRGNSNLARLHIRFLRETHQGNIEKTAELVLTPTRNRLEEQLRLAKESADKNPRNAAKHARESLEQGRQTLALYKLFFENGSEVLNELADEIAFVCNRLQVAYHDATGDDQTCLEILQATLTLATSTEQRHQIEKNIVTVTGFLAKRKLEPVYTLLNSIQDSKDHPTARLARFHQEAIPAIVKTTDSAFSPQYGYPSKVSIDFKKLLDDAATVLRGIALEAWNVYHDQVTALAATHLALQHAVGPDLRTQLLEDDTALVSIRSQRPHEVRPKKITAAALVVLGIFAVIGVIDQWNTTNNSPSPSSYTQPAPSTPAYTPPPTFGGGDSEGKVYRVPSSVSSTLASEKTQIESERIALESLQTRVEELGHEIDRDRLLLDNTSQLEINNFNAKVSRYNALAEEARNANTAFNEKVYIYNAKLQQYGR